MMEKDINIQDKKEINSIIDIDVYLEDFKDHLSYNDRVMFSAQFGDGKTYFLNEFKNKFNNEYEFITIYPVNYQVSSNKEIFELIKRDVLIQVCNAGLLTFSEEVNMEIATKYFLLNNYKDIIPDLLCALGELGIPSVKGVGKLLELLNSHISKIEEQRLDPDEKKVEKFIENIDAESNIYEYDYITELITRAILSSKKDVVLVIEDLDRIDPAHIFRILNVFAAHIDRTNSILVKEHPVNNKFGFKKVITVCDYDKIECVYHHLYGDRSDFIGYIHKYIAHQPFRYSIKFAVRTVVKSYLLQEYDISISKMRESNYFWEVLNSLSIRHVLSSIMNLEYQVKSLDIESSYQICLNNSYSEIRISSNNKFTKLLALFFRLGIKSSKWKDCIVEMESCCDVLNCVGDFYVFQNNVNLSYDISAESNTYITLQYDIKQPNIYLSNLIFMSNIHNGYWGREYIDYNKIDLDSILLEAKKYINI